MNDTEQSAKQLTVQITELRDQFAMAALNGMLVKGVQSPASGATFGAVAKIAYEIADAMLAAREQK